MRKRNLYQLYDLEAQIIAGPVMPEIRDNAAIRSFYALLEDKRTTPGQYPEHFEVRLVAVQDEETGMVTAVIPYKVVASGAQWSAYKRADGDEAEGMPRAYDVRLDEAERAVQ